MCEFILSWMPLFEWVEIFSAVSIICAQIHCDVMKTSREFRYWLPDATVRLSSRESKRKTYDTIMRVILHRTEFKCDLCGFGVPKISMGDFNTGIMRISRLDSESERERKKS